MTFHATRTKRRAARGHRPNRKLGHNTSPRISVSLPAGIMHALADAARDLDVPVSSIMRVAIERYLGRIK